MQACSLVNLVVYFSEEELQRECRKGKFENIEIIQGVENCGNILIINKYS